MRVPIPENGGIYVCDGRLYKPGYGWSELAYPPLPNQFRSFIKHPRSGAHSLAPFLHRETGL